MALLLQRWRPIGLLTVAYAVTSSLGMSLVPPPFYGSPVFPAGKPGASMYVFWRLQTVL